MLLLGCLIGLIAVLLFLMLVLIRRNTNPLRQIMNPSFHSSSLNTRRLIHLGRTAAKSLWAPRMAAVKFLFYALCVWLKFGFQVTTSFTLLPNPTPTSQAHVNCPKHFPMIFELSTSKRWPFIHQQINVCVFFCSKTFNDRYFADRYYNNYYYNKNHNM